jgi:HK97 gp10 family phage protein
MALFEVKGLKETLEVFEKLQAEIGDKEAKSKILIPSVKEAMRPVLAKAKADAPQDTGLLHNSLYITGRRPTKKDMKSKYMNPKDSVVAIVSTRPIPRRVKKALQAEHGHLKGAEYKRARKAFYEDQGYAYDARAIANEFGTAKMSAHPFMRSALESQAQSVATKLGEILRQKMEQYRSKMV